MNPFYFGTSERRLFGVYEPAAAGSSRQRAAVLCYPWGAEYIYAHRTFRELALKLTAAGFHTLRFDNFGTGDSGGESTETDLAGCEADLETAIAELIEITRLAKVTIIGLRLGGSVAANVALRCPGVIEALVLWDPILFGSEYLNFLGVPLNAASLIQAQGFPLIERMISQLRQLDLKDLIIKLECPTLLLVTERSPSINTPVSTEKSAGSPSFEVFDDVQPWQETAVVSGLIPFGILRRILSWLNDTQN